MNEDEFFQALSSPYRRDILRLLRSGSMSAGDICAHFNISQPSISRHLDILRRTGLVDSRRNANQIIYSLHPEALKQWGPWLKQLL